METNSHRPEDLSDVERRLSSWKPDAAGLDPDAMLFAAGRASARPGPARFVWPALTACLAGLAVVLGVWLVDERSERLALAHRLQQQAPATVPPPVPPPSIGVAPAESLTGDEFPPDSYLSAHRALERGLDAWPARAVVRAGPPGPLLPNPPVLQVGKRDVLLDP